MIFTIFRDFSEINQIGDPLFYQEGFASDDASITNQQASFFNLFPLSSCEFFLFGFSYTFVTPSEKMSKVKKVLPQGF